VNLLKDHCTQSGKPSEHAFVLPGSRAGRVAALTVVSRSRAGPPPRSSTPRPLFGFRCEFWLRAASSPAAGGGRESGFSLADAPGTMFDQHLTLYIRSYSPNDISYIFQDRGWLAIAHHEMLR